MWWAAMSLMVDYTGIKFENFKYYKQYGKELGISVHLNVDVWPEKKRTFGTKLTDMWNDLSKEFSFKPITKVLQMKTIDNRK